MPTFFFWRHHLHRHLCGEGVHLFHSFKSAISREHWVLKTHKDSIFSRHTTDLYIDDNKDIIGRTCSLANNLLTASVCLCTMTIFLGAEFRSEPANLDILLA